MKRFFLLILLALLAFPLCGNAQPSFSPTADSASNSLFFDLDAVGFLRDAEFFLPEAKGYTASGFRLAPTLSYSYSSKLKFQAGALLTGVAGTQGLWKVEPIVSFYYRPWRPLTLIMGTLQGSLNHHLDEPMYDRERWFYDYKEDGLQLLLNTRPLQWDLWLNWEEFLEPWTPHQERFVLGSYSNVNLISTERISSDQPALSRGTNVSIPIYFTGAHRGGQFSSLDTCIETLFNYGAALRIARSRHAARNSQTVSVELPAYFFNNMSPQNERYTPFTAGYALYPQAKLQLAFAQRECSLKAGYYRAHNYISSRGSYLFQSVSWFDSQFTQPDRHMLTATLEYRNRIDPRSALSADAEFYYDLDLHQLDFAFGLSLQFAAHKKLNATHPACSKAF